MFYAVVILLSIASAVLCHHLAQRRGARAVPWGVAGLVFGPLAIPFVFLLCRRKRPTGSD